MFFTEIQQSVDPIIHGVSPLPPSLNTTTLTNALVNELNLTRERAGKRNGRELMETRVTCTRVRQRSQSSCLEEAERASKEPTQNRAQNPRWKAVRRRSSIFILVCYRRIPWKSNNNTSTVSGADQLDATVREEAWDLMRWDEEYSKSRYDITYVWRGFPFFSGSVGGCQSVNPASSVGVECHQMWTSIWEGSSEWWAGYVTGMERNLGSCGDTKFFFTLGMQHPLRCSPGVCHHG